MVAARLKAVHAVQSGAPECGTHHEPIQYQYIPQALRQHPITSFTHQLPATPSLNPAARRNPQTISTPLGTADSPVESFPQDVPIVAQLRSHDTIQNNAFLSTSDLSTGSRLNHHPDTLHNLISLNISYINIMHTKQKNKKKNQANSAGHR